MADEFNRGFPPVPGRPWWILTPFRFGPPATEYDSDVWRSAVLQHGMMLDFLALIRARVGWGGVQGVLPEHVDDQGHWFPLLETLIGLDITGLPDRVFPLPQPRLSGSTEANEWLLGLDLDREEASPTHFVPFGLIASRLAPESARPMAQLVVAWLAYCVLPICTQYGGPSTWSQLDQMLNPAISPGESV